MSNISTDQVNFLKTVATLAYGSGSGEGTTGGKGHMALLSVGGKLRVVKCNTHFNHAAKVQNAINNSDKAAELRQSLIDGSRKLSQMLREIGESLGLDDAVMNAIRESAGDGTKQLLTRKAVAAFVSAAKDKVKANGNETLENIWTAARDNAVKSDFSMTFEKVSGENATDFKGGIDRSELKGQAEFLTSLNRNLGLSDGEVFKNHTNNPILALSQKLTDDKLLTSDDEALLTQLSNYGSQNADANAPFGKDSLNKLLTDAYKAYGVNPSEEELNEFRASEELNTTVVGILTGKRKMNALTELAEKTAREVAVGVIDGKINELNKRGLTLSPITDGDNKTTLQRYVQILGGNPNEAERLGLGWLNDPAVTLKSALQSAVREKHGGFSGNMPNALTEALAKDVTVINGLAALLREENIENVRNFGDLVEDGCRRLARSIAFANLKAKIGNSNDPTFKTLFDLASAATSGQMTNELKETFLGAYKNLVGIESKRRALGNGDNPAFMATKEFVAVLKDDKTIGIEFPDVPQFFPDQILETCGRLADKLVAEGLAKTGERLTKLIAALRTERSTGNYKVLYEFLGNLNSRGLCEESIATHAGYVENRTPPFSVQIDNRLRGEFPNLPADDRSYLLTELTKEFASSVDEKIVNASFSSERFEEELKQGDDFGGKCIQLLQKRDKNFMSQVTGYDKITSLLTKNGKGESQIISRDSTDTLTDTETNAVYRRIDVRGGRDFGSQKYFNFNDQSCLLHSVLKGLGYDVTRENGLFLRQALNNFINDCIQKIPADKRNSLNTKSQIRDFIRLFNPEYVSDDIGPGTQLASEFYNGKPFDITSPSRAMSDSFIPFLATLLNRPIVLSMPLKNANGYQWHIAATFDFDIMTGGKLKSNDPPLTIMFNGGHYQSLELIENKAEIPQSKKETTRTGENTAPKKPITPTPKKTEPPASKKPEPAPKKPEPAPKTTASSANHTVTTLVTDKKIEKIDKMLKETFLKAGTEGFDEISDPFERLTGVAIPEKTLGKMSDTLFAILAGLAQKISSEYDDQLTKDEYDRVAQTIAKRVTALLKEPSEEQFETISCALENLQQGHRYDDLALMIKTAQLRPKEWFQGPKTDQIGFCVRTALFNGIAEFLLLDMADCDLYAKFPELGVSDKGKRTVDQAYKAYKETEHDAHKYLQKFL